MKFYTLEWWSGQCEGADDLFKHYKSALDGFIDQLPEAHQRLARELSLHDARMRLLEADYALKPSIFDWTDTATTRRAVRISIDSSCCTTPRSKR